MPLATEFEAVGAGASRTAFDAADPDEGTVEKHLGGSLDLGAHGVLYTDHLVVEQCFVETFWRHIKRDRGTDAQMIDDTDIASIG